MNLKYYIRGVGIGVVVTTLILTIAFQIRQGDVQNTLPPENSGNYLDDIVGGKGESKSQEDASSDVSKESSSENESNSETESNSENESSSENESRPAKEEESKNESRPVGGDEPLKPSSEGTVQDPQSIQPPQNIQTPQNVTVDLTAVASSEQASRIIAAAGLVSDWEAFNNYLIDNGYESRVQSRVYTIKAGSDFATIAKIITGR